MPPSGGISFIAMLNIANRAQQVSCRHLLPARYCPCRPSARTAPRGNASDRRATQIPKPPQQARRGRAAGTPLGGFVL
jgi:hypothetical protein